MRYISQFEINKDSRGMEYFDKTYEMLKHKTARDIGEIIVEKVGIEKKGESDMSMRFGIEIQAFSIDEWVKFKTQLKEYIELTNGPYGGNRMLDLIFIGKLFRSLENAELLNKEPNDERSVAKDA